MKLSSFIIKESGVQTIGVFTGEHYIDLVELTDGALSRDMNAFLAAGDAALNKAQSAVTDADEKQNYLPAACLCCDCVFGLG